MAPLEDRSYITVNSVAQEGITFDYMERYGASMIEMIEEDVAGSFENLMTNVGSNNVNASWVRVKLVEPEFRQHKQQEIADELSQKVKLLTGARSYVTQQQTFGGRRGGLPVQYIIQAKNLEGLKQVMPAFMEEVSKSPVFAASDLNLKFTKPEVTITINREKAALLGLSVQNIAQTLQLTMSEQRIGYYIYNGKQYQILSQYDRHNRNKPSDLTNAYVRNADNELIQLDNVVTVRESSMPPQLYRYNRFVAATVSAGLSKGHTLGQGITEMNRIAEVVLSKDDFSTTLFGDSKDFAESSSSLLFAFVLALILIYLILAAQFESFRDPIIIMVTVPLSVIGALLAIKVYGQTMNIFSEIGIIMLIGLVTKNGILIVEFANQRRAAGLPMREAIQDAAVSRFRPILMTSLATILGILPLAMASGAGAESRVAMGITVVGGMICATFLTLYVIPAVYSYFVAKR
jgi:multidrug efflux pump